MRLQIPKLPSFKPRAKVGDVVYYISPNNRFAVKRAVVVEIKRSGSEYRQVMSNRDVVVKDAHSVVDYTTFANRDDAMQFIITSLVERINNHKTRFATLQHESDVSERVLATLFDLSMFNIFQKTGAKMWHFIDLPLQYEKGNGPNFLNES